MRGLILALAAAAALAAAPLSLAQTAHPLADAVKQRVQREIERRVQGAPATTTTATTAAADQPIQAVAPANQEWTLTRAVVQNGARLQISAGDGSWSTSGQAAVNRLQNLLTNADGYAGRTDPHARVPDANLGALIGKIGENGTPFLVGSKYDATANADGPLFLAINDLPGGYANNTGRMPASITVTAPPPPEQTTVPAPTTETTTETTTQTTTGVDTTTATAEPAPAEPTEAPTGLPSWAIPVGVGALLIGVIMLWPRKPPSKPRAPRNTPKAGVTTRITDDGRGSQQLSVTWKDRK